MSRYGLFGKMLAQQGKRDELVSYLLQATELLKSAQGCEIYIINVSSSEPDAIWVTEVWQSQADHQASLTIEGIKAIIGQARPLIADFSDRVELTPVGGVGLA
jgi:quinol monooxygenase YgiN